MEFIAAGQAPGTGEVHLRYTRTQALQREPPILRKEFFAFDDQRDTLGFMQ
jgi:hypothetical protein